jgi:KAP family P-loop domain
LPVGLPVAILNIIAGVRMYVLANDAPETDGIAFAQVWPGMDRFSARLVRILELVPATTPVLISGDWGSGKTSLLRALERRVQSMRPVVWFEAWRYDGQGSLLPALMRTVWDAAPADWRMGQDPSVLERLMDAAFTVGMRVGPEVAKLAGVPMLGALLTPPRPGSAPAAPGKPGLEPSPDPVRALWESFSKLVREAWKDQAPPLILLDDLDRCDPHGMVGVLEHIRTLVAGDPDLHARFVVAIDRTIIVQAIGIKFSGISGYDGNRYLEKVFPLSFNLPAPAPGEVSRMVDHVWGKGMNRDDRDGLTQSLRDPVFANPRLIKRVVNKYRLVLQLEAEVDEEPDPNRPVALRNRYLARWLAASERWPRLRVLLVRQPDDFWEQLQKALAEGRSTDPEVEALLREQGARSWMLRELLKENPRANVLPYRDAEGRLTAVGL